MPLLVIGVGIVVALVLLAVVLIPVFIDEDVLADLARSAVRTHLGGELVISGDSRLTVFPQLSVSLSDARLTIPAREERAYAISADLGQVSLGLSVLPALRGETEFSKLSIHHIHARIKAPADTLPTPTRELSDSEWEQMGKAVRAAQERERQRLLNNNVSTMTVFVAADALEISDVTIDLLNNQGDLEKRLALEELLLVDINTADRPVSLETKLALSTEDNSPPLSITATGRLRVPSDLAHITIEQLDTTLIGALDEPVTASLQGELALWPLHLSATITSRLPGGDVSGEIVYAALESPQIDISLSSTGLDLDQLRPAVSGEAPTTQPSRATSASAATTPQPALPPLPLPVGPLRFLDLALSIQADHLISARQHINAAALGLRVRDGIADLEYLRGELFDGRLTTTAKINTRKPVVELVVDGGLTGVNLDTMMTSLDRTDTLAGNMDLSWSVRSRGATAADLSQGLTGDVDATGSNVVIENLSLQALLCDAIAQINQSTLSATLPETTSLDTLELSIDLADARATIDQLNVTTNGLALSGSGGFSLTTQDFSVLIDSRVDEALGDLDPACRVNARYRAIAWPVRCSGHISEEPGSWCRVDTNRIAEQLLRNEAARKLRQGLNRLFN